MSLQLANLIEHEACGFVVNASFALDLLCRVAATSGTHQVHRLEPNAKRGGALLENGSNERIDMIPAMITSVRPASRDAIMHACLLAVRTVDYASNLL